MAGEEELGAEFLITLKRRGVMPEILDAASKCLAEMLEPMEEQSKFEPCYLLSPSTGTNPTEAIDRSDISPPKIDTVCMNKEPSFSMPLSLPEDSRWLSDLQCYVRSRCCEFFTATDADIKNDSKTGPKRFDHCTNSLSSSGGQRRHRTKPGRVGIRCVFCHSLSPRMKASKYALFPSQISGIYSAVVMMQCHHFPNCLDVPPEVIKTLNDIKETRNVLSPPGSLPTKGCCVDGATNYLSNGGTASGRHQYWVESARRLGLVDTPDGIRFSSAASKGSSSMPTADFSFSNRVAANATGDTNYHQNQEIMPDRQFEMNLINITPELSSNDPGPLDIPNLLLTSSLHKLRRETLLVTPDDKDLVPDYLFLAMAQMRPCSLSESDRVGCYKDRDLGFKGMCCKHCGGQPGFGKYFPATVRSLAQTTTSQTIVKHVGVKCRLCPLEVRRAVLSLQQNSLSEIKGRCNYSRGASAANDDRPKYGSRKMFFQRVWARLQGEDVPEIPKFEAAPIPIAVGHESSDKACSSQEQTSKPLNNEASISEVDDDFGDDILSTRFFPSEDELEADGDDANVGYTAMDSNSGCRIPTRSSFRHGSRLVDDISSKRKAIGKNHKMSKRFKRVLLDSK